MRKPVQLTGLPKSQTLNCCFSLIIGIACTTLICINGARHPATDNPETNQHATMNLLNTTERYGTLSIIMHWLMLLLMIAVYVCADLREIFPRGGYLRESMKVWHNELGLLVFALVWLRLALYLFSLTPVIQPASASWQTNAAKLMHFALYALMIGAPLLGWLSLSAAGKPISFFGYELPALLGPDRALGKTIKEVHETVGSAGYVLIGAHALAALFHHYIIKDNTLLRMLPRRKARTGTCA